MKEIFKGSGAGNIVYFMSKKDKRTVGIAIFLVSAIAAILGQSMMVPIGNVLVAASFLGFLGVILGLGLYLANS